MKWCGASVVVTGGAGFIGSNLALELQSRGARVTAVDDFSCGTALNLDGFKGRVIRADAAGRAWARGLKPAAIFHLASCTDTTVENERKMMRNADQFERVLDIAKKIGAPVVYASSAAVYGNGPSPMKETQKRDPRNAYAVSKCRLEDFALETDVPNVGLRYFNVYGPRETHKKLSASMITRLALQMLAGKRPRLFKWGEQKRDFIFVGDVVAITIRAMERLASKPDLFRKFRVLNVGTGAPASFNEVVAALNAAMKTNLEPAYFDNPYAHFYQSFTQAETKTLRRALGTGARCSIQKGALRTMRALR